MPVAAKTAELSLTVRETAELVESDPQRAMLVAEELGEQARRQRDPGVGAIAAYALGLAAGKVGDLDGAAVYYRRAIGLAQRADAPSLQGEIRTSLAIVLAYLGRTRSALHCLEVALNQLQGVQRARARAQRGAVLQMVGRPDAALAEYRAALPTLRRSEDHLWTVRVLANRGNLFTHRRAFVSALADLDEAKRLSEEHGFPIIAGNIEHNLGWLETFRGHIPDALKHLDLADRCYKEFGFPRGPLLCDRSQVLLSARLLDEAKQAATEAIDAAAGEHRLGSVAEAHLLLARVERLQGDIASALMHARTASNDFRRSNQPTWAGLARVLAMTWRAEAEPGYDPRRIDSAIDASHGLWPDATLDAIIAVARSTAAAGRPRRAHNLLIRASRGRRGGPAFVRSRAWYAEALDRYASGNLRGAESAIRTGLRILDEQSANFDASDVRAHVAGHRVQLTRLGVKIALEANDPRRVLEWSDLARASHLQPESGRHADHPELAESLAELRLVVRDLEHETPSRVGMRALEQRQRELEAEIRDNRRRQSRNHRPEHTNTLIDVTTEDIGDRALVEYVEHEGRLHAVCQVDDSVSLRQLALVAEVHELEQKLRFGLRRMAHPGSLASRAATARALVAATADRLDTTLVRPITDIKDRSIVLVPTGVLQSMPWSVFPSLAGRPICVSPSAALWHAVNARTYPRGPAVVAAGPGLLNADVEACSVAAIYGTSPLTGSAASTREVSRLLDGASVAHLAAHGRVRADNPLFGSLRLADGPLMIYDLEQLARAPHTLVVAACDAGRPIVPAGDELLGLAATLLSQGGAQLVASSVPVLDAATAPLMVALHRELIAGRSAAEALAIAQQGYAATGPAQFATAASFLCFGAGFAAPPLATAEIRSGSTR